METIRYNGAFINFREMKAQVGYYHCVLCNEPINIGQKIYSVLKAEEFKDNNKLFPNVIIHKSCAEPMAPFDKNNPLVWVADQLRKSWKAAQQYKHWWI